jgi:hypothetical protein
MVRDVILKHDIFSVRLNAAKGHEDGAVVVFAEAKVLGVFQDAAVGFREWQRQAGGIGGLQHQSDILEVL